MTSGPDGVQLSSDAELITRVRAGDRSAFGELYSRHAAAAATLARQFAGSAAEADDLVSEAFARVLDGLLDGKGPDTAFRAYLFTTVRHTAYDRTRKDKRLQFTDQIESHDVAVEADDPVIADLENGLVAKAFAGLPERWQAVLWHTQVEGQSAAEVGVLLGMAPNAVSSLAFRAREGLREGYLQAHLAETAAEQCRTTVDRLGAWTRGGLSKREKAQVDEHLKDCDRCRALALELTEINSGLRGVLAPILLGTAAVGYLATLGPVTPLVQLGAITGATGLGAQTAGFGTTGLESGGAATTAAGGTTTGTTGGAGGAGAIPGKTWAARGGVLAAAGVAVVAVVVAWVFASGVFKSANNSADSGNGTAAAANGGAGNGGAGGGGGGGGNGGGGAGAAGGTGTGGGTGGAGGAGTGGTGPGGTGAPGTGGGAGAPTTNAGGQATQTGPTGPTGQNGTGQPPPTNPGGGSTDNPTTSLTGTGPTDTTGSTTSSTGAAPSTNTTAPTTATTTTSPTTATTGTTATTATTATTGTTATTATTATTTATTTTTPPPPQLTLPGPPTLGGALVAGGTGTVSLTLTNSGGAATGTGATVTVTAPTGITVGPPATALALRRMAAMAAAGPTCSSLAPLTCSLPDLAAGQQLTLTFPLAALPTAADGDITFTLSPGGAAATVSRSVSITLTSGYAGVDLSAAPLARAATNRVHLTATQTADSTVTDPGPLRIPLAMAPGVTVVRALPATGQPDCTAAASALVCPAAAVTAGLDLEVAAGTDAVTPATLATAADAGGRAVDLTGSLTVDPNLDDNQRSRGGYAQLSLGDPEQQIRAGGTTTLLLRGLTLNDGVINPGPVTLPIALADGLTITEVPQGCTRTVTEVSCGPLDGQPLSVPLTVSARPDAGGASTSALLPTGTTVSLPLPEIVGGYGSVELAGKLPAGHNADLTLTATPAIGVTDPGPITLPARPSPGLLIIAARGCTPVGNTFVCDPDADHAVSATLTFAVLPGATAADGENLTATLAGGRTQPLAGAHAVTPRAADDPIDLVGPFRAAAVGAPLIGCPGPQKGDKDLHLDRTNCDMEALTGAAANPAPKGSTIVWAGLTWTATEWAADGDSPVVNGIPVPATAVQPTRTVLGTTVTDPEVRSRTADVTGSINPGGPLTVTGLVPDSNTQRTMLKKPMGAWTLVVIWTQPDAGTSRVRVLTPAIYIRDGGVADIFTSPRWSPAPFVTLAAGEAQTVTMVAGGSIDSAQVVLWATDPFGIKTVSSGKQVLALPTRLTGTALAAVPAGVYPGGNATGMDLLSLTRAAGAGTSLTVSSPAINNDRYFVGVIVTVAH